MSDDPRAHTTEIRVRYCECDPMGLAHHSAYPVWFEMGRTESCRAMGLRYRDMEDEGAFLAVIGLEVAYRAPARYDDVITLETIIERATRAKLEHRYELTRDGLILATAQTRLACVDRNGRPRPLPAALTDSLAHLPMQNDAKR